MENEFTFENPEYRKTYWHTCSHIMAQAVSRVEPWSNAYYLTPDTIQGWGFLFIQPRSQGGTDYERSQQGIYV